MLYYILFLLSLTSFRNLYQAANINLLYYQFIGFWTDNNIIEVSAQSACIR
jgi:hypothetical protein